MKRVSVVLVALALAWGSGSASQAALQTGDAVILDFPSGVVNRATSGGVVKGQGGGEFRIREIVDPGTGMTPIAGTYIDPVKVFCLEINEYISNGGRYWVTIDDYAVLGGVDVLGTYPGDPSGGLVGGERRDPLSNASKWLYATYRSGMLGTLGLGYSYNDNESAGYLQAAFWALENELTGSHLTEWDNLPETSAQKKLFNAAVNNATNVPSVKVLNLWGTRTEVNGVYVYSDPKQSQIYQDFVIPEPGSLAVWSLMVGSATGVAVAKKRRQRTTRGRWSRDTRQSILAIVEGKLHP